MLQMAPSSPPCFYKILLHPSHPHLALPPAFVTKHLENNIPNNPTLQSATGGYSWRLKIKQIGETYCFADGWKNVVEDAQLGFGDFLVFSLLDQNTFQVRIYAPSGCVKDLPSKLQLQDDDDGDGDPFFITIISKSHTNCLRLPREFVGLAGIDAEGTITLKNLAGKEWQVGLRWEKSTPRYYLSSGWRDFYRGNRLSIGNECIFKFIRSERKFSLTKVTKKKAVSRQPPAQILATEVAKRKRGRPPRKDRGGVDVESDDECVEVVQRPQGRSPHQKSGDVYF